jgi:hypothetical protein
MLELLDKFFYLSKFHLGKAKQGGGETDYRMGCYYHHIFHSLYKVWAERSKV